MLSASKVENHGYFLSGSSFNEGASLEKLFVVSTCDLPGCTGNPPLAEKTEMQNTQVKKKTTVTNEHGSSTQVCLVFMAHLEHVYVRVHLILWNMIQLTVFDNWNDFLEAPPRGK